MIPLSRRKRNSNGNKKLKKLRETQERDRLERKQTNLEFFAMKNRSARRVGSWIIITD